jgi:N-acetylneuraminate lyase
MSSRRFKGLIAPVINAQHHDGSLNLEIIPKYVELLVKNKVTGAFVCGTAGEGTSLTIAERKQVVAKWVESSKNKVEIIAHIGSNCLEDSKDLARHAESVGVDAVALVAPSYIKPETVDALVSYCKEVAAAAPKTPFFYYHFPGITNVNFSAISFLERASKVIPNLQGIKFTHHDFFDFGLCVEYEGGKYDILNGFEHVLLAGLAFGCHGGIGITFSLIGAHYAKIFEAFAKNDVAEARRLHQQGVHFYAVLNRFGLIRAHKVALKKLGLDMGPVRLPLVDLTDTEAQTMLSDLEKTELYKEYF